MPTRRDLANAIRALSMDAVQKANSGHPGAPLGMADIAQVLWCDFLRHNPLNPHWFNRDRFVLSNGHASMLLYALLHLSGYAVSLEDIQQFRQLHSKTPGHPEVGITPGVETTTGPLGQGLANAVGMAIAERELAAVFNRPGHNIVDHHTYVFLGDGCLMEGISHEACSLAGTLGLGKLIAFWDDNGISIDGEVTPWFSDNTPERFSAYGWHVIPNVDGHDAAAVLHAINVAQAETKRPTLICCKTVIAFGAPKLAGTCKAHGAPLGTDEITATRKALAWPYAPFEIPAEIYQAWDAKAKGKATEQAWQSQFEAYQKAFPDLAKEFLRRMTKQLPDFWSAQAEQTIQQIQTKAENIATRKASLNALNVFAPHLPELVGGSADLTESNLTMWQGATAINQAQHGNYLFYGVREFGMSAIMNGIALHGGFIPFGGTFLTFSDYARNAVRMAALMQQQVIFIYTHDSIGLGEDGPTHQPIEHAAMLRLTPGLSVWRPCDAAETAVAWRLAIERRKQPTCLLLSRQNLPAQARDANALAAIARGGYVLWENSQHPEVILIATGSEVALAVQAAQQVAGVAIRVVSMPSTDTFDAQALEYREHVLPDKVSKRIAIEAAAKDYWYKYVGRHGTIIGLDRFGESAPGDIVMNALGITVAAIKTAILAFSLQSEGLSV